MPKADSYPKDVYCFLPEGKPTVKPVPRSDAPVHIELSLKHAEAFQRRDPTKEGVVSIYLTREQAKALREGLSKLDHIL